MKRIIYIAAILLLVFTVFVFTGCANAVANINGFELKRSEVDLYLDFITSQNPDITSAGNEEMLGFLESQVIEALVINRLLEEHAAKNDISVTEEEFEAEFEEIKGLHVTEEEFLQELKNNNMTLDFLKKELRVQILRNKIFDIETQDVVVSEEEMLQYYEENKDTYFKVEEQARMGHILIRFEGQEGEQDLTGAPTEEELLTKSEAYEKISEIKREIDDGASFEDLAKEHSQDPFSAENGGEMGFIGKGQLVEEFEEAAFKLKDGEVSTIVETMFGYHIIKMYEYQEESYLTYDESKADIKDYIEYINKNEKWEEFLSSLKEKADIEYFVEMTEPPQ
jgi:foldase protein PrsA